MMFTVSNSLLLFERKVRGGSMAVGALDYICI